MAVASLVPKKPRKGAGKTKTGWRLRGSAKAVKLLQHDALDALVEAATQDEALAAAQGQAPPDARATFAGLTRHNLLKRASEIELP